MFDIRNKFAAVLGLSFGLTAPTTRLQSEVLASTARLPNTTMHLRGKRYPHSSTRQRDRGARQIASGMCTQANGLVRPGQIIINKDGRLFVCRPY